MPGSLEWEACSALGHTSTHLALPKLLGVVFCLFNLALDTYCVPGTVQT